MNILVLGSGGREHALAWKIAQSEKCEQLYIAPGNAGTALCGKNVDLNLSQFDLIGKFVIEHNVNMVVVGPEAPLVGGIHDFFANHGILKNIPVIGPAAAGAQLEGSKDFSKRFMQKYNIPTAGYRSFNIDQVEDGINYIRSCTPPIVLKADGLAAGKGVLICRKVEEAETEFRAMLDGKFGEAGNLVVIEEFLDGIEFSVFVLTDGQSYKILPTAKDYKRIGEGDLGLNTGGMGAVSPVPFVGSDLMQQVEEQIIQRTLNGLQEENIDYSGFIYFGLINVNNAPYVIEYNIRLGDPEAEVVLPRIQSDFVDLLEGVAGKDLAQKEIRIDDRAATTVVLASGGYPGSYHKGKPISGLEHIQGSIVFHAGTKKDNGQVLTNGGRVMAITSFGENIPTAIALSNQNANLIQFEDKYFRRDIGFDV